MAIVNGLCIRWIAIDAEADKQHLPLASHWRWCSETSASDQVETARALGLLEDLNRPPHPARTSVDVAIR
jgi:hypothetical protein